MKEFLLSFLLFASVAQAQNTDFTAGTADIIDLTDQTGVTSWNLSDVFGYLIDTKSKRRPKKLHGV